MSAIKVAILFNSQRIMLALPDEYTTVLPPEIFLPDPPAKPKRVAKKKADKPAKKSSVAVANPVVVATSGVAPTTYGSSDGKVFIARHIGSTTVSWD
jgi:hypothetical protein